MEEPQEIDNFLCQFGKLHFFELNAPAFYEVPCMTWQETCQMHSILGLAAADYYTSVRDYNWYQLACAELGTNLANLKAEGKNLDSNEITWLNEMVAKITKKIEECKIVMEELTPNYDEED